MVIGRLAWFWKIIKKTKINLMIRVKKALQIILAFTIIGCHTSEKNKDTVQSEEHLIHFEFGKPNTLNNKNSVELDFSNYNKWSEVVGRVEKITCKGSLVKTTLASEKEKRTIYFNNNCLRDSSVLIKQKNVIEIYNNNVRKNLKAVFPIDSLEYIVQRDIENKGKHPDLSESSEKLFFSVYYDDNVKFKNLPGIIKKLSDIYFKITDRKDLKIWLTGKGHFGPPEIPRAKI